MRKVIYLTAALLCFNSYTVLADDASMDQNSTKPCGVVANACLQGGYTRDNSNDKEFWHDCMRPLLLGQSVDGVTLPAGTAKSCRQDKIKELKSELQDFQNVKD